MRRLLLRALLFFIVSAIFSRIIALLASQQFDEGDEDSDAFRRVVVMDGGALTSRASALRSGEVTAVMSGMRLDLREATLDPAGAELRLENTMSGLQVLVRDDWAVSVDDQLVGGGNVEIDVAAPDDLPEDSPKLRIRLVTRMGGSVIGTSERFS